MPKFDASCAGFLEGKGRGGAAAGNWLREKNKKDIGLHLTFHFS
jgi:hypothetical protein